MDPGSRAPIDAALNITTAWGKHMMSEYELSYEPFLEGSLEHPFVSTGLATAAFTAAYVAIADGLIDEVPLPKVPLLDLEYGNFRLTLDAEGKYNWGDTNTFMDNYFEVKNELSITYDPPPTLLYQGNGRSPRNFYERDPLGVWGLYFGQDSIIHFTEDPEHRASRIRIDYSY